MGSHAAECQCKNASYHLRCLRVDLEPPLRCRVFLVAVQGKGGDILSLLPLMIQHRADIGRQVFQIPLVDQPIDLPGLFVRRIAGIHMIHHSDEPDAPFNELPVQVFFHQFHIPGKARLGLCQHHIEFMFAGSLYHRIERRTVPVDAGVILIGIDLVEFKSLLHSVLEQHGLLVLDAFRFTAPGFVLLAQAAINCCFHALHRCKDGLSVAGL